MPSQPLPLRHHSKHDTAEELYPRMPRSPCGPPLHNSPPSAPSCRGSHDNPPPASSIRPIKEHAPVPPSQKCRKDSSAKNIHPPSSETGRRQISSPKPSAHRPAQPSIEPKIPHRSSGQTRPP